MTGPRLTVSAICPSFCSLYGRGVAQLGYLPGIEKYRQSAAVYAIIYRRTYVRGVVRLTAQAPGGVTDLKDRIRERDRQIAEQKRLIAEKNREALELSRRMFHSHNRLRRTYQLALSGVDLSGGRATDGRRSRGAVSSPTEGRGILLADNEVARAARPKIRWLEQFIRSLAPRERSFVELRLLGNKTRKETMKRMGLSWRQYAALEGAVLLRYTKEFPNFYGNADMGRDTFENLSSPPPTANKLRNDA